MASSEEGGEAVSDEAEGGVIYTQEIEGSRGQKCPSRGLEVAEGNRASGREWVMAGAGVTGIRAVPSRMDRSGAAARGEKPRRFPARPGEESLS